MLADSLSRWTHLDDDRCADLVLGLLDLEARDRALTHAEGCLDCESRLRSHVVAAGHGRAAWRAHLGIHRVPAAPPQAASLGIAPPDAPERAPRGPAFAFHVPGLAIAAAVLVVAAFVPMIGRPGHVSDESSWLPASGDVVRLRGDDGEDAHLVAGLAAYDERDLATAARELAAAHGEGSVESVRRLYLAHVRLLGGNAHEALALLLPVPWARVPEPWRREGVTLLARAWRAEGQFARADSLDRALRTLDPATPFLP